MDSPVLREPLHHGVKSEFVKQEEIASGKWLSLNKITYKDPTNQQREWEAVYRTTSEGVGADAVVIIPILKRLLKYDCVIMVKQYRPPMKGFTLEFPAGLIDRVELPEDTAVRELKEETGYVGVAKHCSPATCLDPGAGNCTAVMVTVEIDGDDLRNKVPESNPDETEFIEVLKVPLDSLLETLNKFSKQGVVVHATVYSYAIAMEQTKRNKALLSPVSKKDGQNVQ